MAFPPMLDVAPALWRERNKPLVTAAESRCSWCVPTSGNPASCWLPSVRGPATIPPPAARRRSPIRPSPAAGFLSVHVHSLQGRLSTHLPLTCPLVGPADSIQSATAPGNGRPDPLVQVIPRDLGYDLKPGDRPGDLDLSGEKPADRKRVECSQRPPANGFENRSCVCLCSAE